MEYNIYIRLAQRFAARCGYRVLNCGRRDELGPWNNLEPQCWRDCV